MELRAWFSVLLTQYFQICVASPSAYMTLSRVYSLVLSYYTSHSFFII